MAEYLSFASAGLINSFSKSHIKPRALACAPFSNTSQPCKKKTGNVFGSMADFSRCFASFQRSGFAYFGPIKTSSSCFVQAGTTSGPGSDLNSCCVTHLTLSAGPVKRCQKKQNGLIPSSKSFADCCGVQVSRLIFFKVRRYFLLTLFVRF